MNAQKKLVVCTMVALACLSSTAAAGPAYSDYLWDVTVVRGHSTVTYTETFQGGEVALVTLNGDGRSDLDIFVYDANGNLIISEESTSDNVFVSFIPYWTSEFRIVVRNLGSASNAYRIEMR
jgi:hypothetical protein